MRRSRGYALWTGSGVGSYRSWERAVGAARLAAGQSHEVVVLLDDHSGRMWDVAPGGRLSNHQT
jgi:hypothetical protein